MIHFIFSIPTYKPNRRLNEAYKKKLYKLLGKMNKKNRSVEELNQFLLSEVKITNNKYLNIDARKKAEDSIKDIRHKFTDKLLKDFKKIFRKDPELRASLKVFVNINSMFNIDMNLEEMKILPDKITSIINTIYQDGTLMIWDLPGSEIDRIVAGDVIINREQDSIEEADIGIIADELTLASFGKHHVPLISSQIDNIERITGILFNFLDKYLTYEFTFINNEQKNLYIDLSSIVLGKILGIRESLLMAEKQLKRYQQLENEMKEEGNTIGSSFLSDIFTKFIIPEELENTLGIIEKLNNLISQNVDKIRDIYTKAEQAEISDKTLDINEFTKLSFELYLAYDTFRLITDTFQDIPSFTAIGGDIATETGSDVLLIDNEEYIINIKDVFKTFPLINNTVYAIRGINLNVKRGEFVAIMGSSGSGKTTLLNLLSGLDKPDRGIVFVDGINLVKAKEKTLTRFRSNNVAFIYQSYNLLPILKSIENVKLPADLGTDNKIGSKSKRSFELLETVGLEQFVKTRPIFLSGGQQQRVTIARSLMNKPSLLLCDEPTGDLDVTTGNQIMELLQDLHRDGMTLVVVTHDKAVAARADRVIEMNDGKII